jgi:hypothetical protein
MSNVTLLGFAMRPVIVRVTVTVCGLPLPSDALIGTVAVYVPGAIPPGEIVRAREPPAVVGELRDVWSQPFAPAP